MVSDGNDHAESALARALQGMKRGGDAKHRPQTDIEDARAFLRDLTTAYPVILFHDGPMSADTSDPNRVLADILATIGLSPRLIDTRADITLNLAFDASHPAPQIYIANRQIGGLAHMIKALKDGTVTRLIGLRKLPHDKNALDALIASL